MEGIAEYCDAMLWCWHAGSEAANAATDILFGDVVPSGKMPVTVPRLATHIPLYYNVAPSGRPVDCYYGENPQNCYIDSIPTPYYPFGYGLSYTRFAYGAVQCENPAVSREDLLAGKDLAVSVELSNTGDFDGAETVQLYIHDPVAKMMRPLRELKAFQKVYLKKGERTVVTFHLTAKDLGYYLADATYTLERGKIEIYVGEHCLTENKTEVEIL
jgi:beta-glucosidase